MSIPPKITGVLEAALYAADLDRAEAFYHGVLNMEVVLRLEQRHVFFRAGQTILLVFNPEETAKPSQNTRMPVPAHGAHGPGHVCFRASRDEISRGRMSWTRALPSTPSSTGPTAPARSTSATRRETRWNSPNPTSGSDPIRDLVRLETPLGWRPQARGQCPSKNVGQAL